MQIVQIETSSLAHIHILLSFTALLTDGTVVGESQLQRVATKENMCRNEKQSV